MYSFLCNKGLYEYTVLPQGITNATQTFQKLMDKIFDGIMHKIVETYLDDIVIFSQTLKEHVEHVREVVNRLLKYILKINLAKCKIAQRKLEYLSHIVYHGCIMPNPEKVKALLQFKPPFKIKQAEAFLGKATYYKRFIKDFASIAKPLNDFIHNHQTIWSDEMTKTVEELQIKLTNEPILILPNMKEEFVIETDACGYGVGGVLAQFRDNFYKPVAYFSRRLSKSERNYSTTEKELYAIVLSIENFKQFIYGTHFIVYTDH
jgi:hypothetical protein